MNHNKRKGPLQFLQFSMIGMVNAGIDIGALNLLLITFPTDEKILLVLFNSIANSLAVLNSYFWNAKITFRHTAKGSNWQRFTFILQGIVNLGISNFVFLAAEILLENISVPNWLRYNLAKGLAMMLSSLSSFFMIKYVVFKEYRKLYLKE